MTPEQLKISNAAADAACLLLRSAGLSGLGEGEDAEAGSALYAKEQAAVSSSSTDWGALIGTVVKAATSVATTSIQQRTLTTIAKQKADLQKAQDRMVQRQIDLQNNMTGQGQQASSFSMTSPVVLIPAIIGGVLVLYLVLKR